MDEHSGSPRGWRRALAFAFLALILVSALFSAVRIWNTAIVPPPPGQPAQKYPTLAEQAIVAVSDAPPTRTQPGLNPSVSIEPTAMTGFMAGLNNGDFTRVVINSGSNVAAGIEGDSQDPVIRVTQLAAEQTAALVAGEFSPTEVEIVDPVRAWQVSTALATPAPTTPLPSWVVPSIAVVGLILLFIAGTIFSRRRKQSGEFGASISSSEPGKKSEKETTYFVPPTRFSDVAGCEEAVEDLREIVDYLKNPEKYERVGATIPRGALLIGPPGTGKTLLARAVAGEAGVPFYPVAGSDFVERLVGVGASRVRSLFKKARKHTEGAIIFIDEIDAVGRRRNSSINSHHEQENTLNALLVEMDGFRQDKVIVLAASNRADMLDPALRRPGRLERQVQVPLPDLHGREHILRVHAEGRPLASNVDLAHVARRTPGMSGAELSRVVNEACISAAREDSAVIEAKYFEDAIETVAIGKARLSAVVSERDRLITAWHEAGHTTAALRVESAEKPISVSIIPRGQAGGVTWTQQCEDLFLTRPQARARLVVAMAGRAAEEMLLDGEFTSGPHGDLAAATSLALNMVTRFGMTESRLMVHPEEFLAAGGPVAMETVESVESLLAEALDQARAVLRENSALMQALVDGLMERESLNAQEIAEIESRVLS